MAFYDKIQNTKENKEKQTANQGKSAKNAAAAENRKKNGQGGNQQKNGGQGGGGQQQQSRPWVQPWANSNNQNYQQNDGGGYKGKNFNKSFTEKNCPKCLKPHHGNSPCSS
jgi:hypothetical protein